MERISDKQQFAPNNGEIVLYNPDDTIRLEVRMNDETVWLTQAQMAELFGTQRQASTKLGMEKNGSRAKSEHIMKPKVQPNADTNAIPNLIMRAQNVNQT